jgi:ferredoxin
MSTNTQASFEKHLHSFTESDWNDAVKSLLPSIHEVDRNAVRIWFRFYPLSLDQFLADATDVDEAKRSLAMQGDFGLEGRIDTSASFLYGYRYWNTVKAVIRCEAETFQTADGSLTETIDRIATLAAAKAKVEKQLIVAITAVALMTVVQAGLEAFTATTNGIAKPAGLMSKSPGAIIADRRKDDSQGLFGFLKTVNKEYSVIHNEQSSNGHFKILDDQEIASASANDRSQNWQASDARCWEGPVPVECTSASCGTCWVGVIAGEHKLSPVARRERRAIKVFGYDQTDSETPVIRLACQAKASGNVTIVIPPWNAVFGKKVYNNVDELELEPVTTSAKALRETVREAVAGESNK